MSNNESFTSVNATNVNMTSEEKRQKVDLTHNYDEAVDLLGNGKYNYLMMMTCAAIAMAVSTDLFAFPIIVASAACDLYLTRSQIGLLTSIPLAGLIFSFFWGYYADTCGRKRALMLSCWMGFVFASLTSIASEWYIMLVFKILASSFSSGAFGIGMAYLGESTGVKHRNLYMQFMNVGNLIAEVFYYGMAYLLLGLRFKVPLPWLGISWRPWRLYTLIMASTLGLPAVLILFLYESPKYLANSGKEDEALVVLQKMFEWNGRKKDDYPVKRIQPPKSEEQSREFNFMSMFTNIGPLFKPPLLLKTLQMFFITLVICTTNNTFTAWFPLIVNTFFISLDKDTGVRESKSFCTRINENHMSNQTNYDERSTCNDVLTDYTLFSGMAVGFFFVTLNISIAKFGSYRKFILLFNFGVSAACCILINLINEAVVNLIMFILIQWTAVCIGITASYFVDLFPTSHRALATTLGMMFGRFGSFVGVNMIGAVIYTHCERTFYLWAVYVMCAVAVCGFLPREKEILKKTKVLETDTDVDR